MEDAPSSGSLPDELAERPVDHESVVPVILRDNRPQRCMNPGAVQDRVTAAGAVERCYGLRNVLSRNGFEHEHEHEHEVVTRT